MVGYGQLSHVAYPARPVGSMKLGLAGLFLFLTMMLLIPLTSNAQMDTLWTKRYQWEGRDEIYDHIQTSDGGYALTGCTTLPGTVKPCLWLLKTDEHGDTLWSSYMQIGDESVGKSVFEEDNGDFTVIGWAAYRYRSVHLDMIFSRFNADGDSILMNNFNSDTTTIDLICNKSIRSSSGGYIASGTFNMYFEHSGYSCFLLVKYSENGDIDWFHSYGIRRNSSSECYDLLEDSDGNYLMAGYGSAYLNGPTGYLIIMANSEGDSITSFGYTLSPTAECIARSITRLNDGNYLIIGQAHDWPQFISGHIWNIAVNDVGDIIWESHVGDAQGQSEYDIPYTDGMESDHGLAFIGRGRKDDVGYSSIWVVDSEGNCEMKSRWDDTTFTYGNSIIPIDENYFSIAGFTGVTRYIHVGDSVVREYHQDSFLAQMTYDLKVDENEDIMLSPNQIVLIAFPNPFNSSTTIRYSTGSAARPTGLAIYDLSGRKVAELLGNAAVTSPQVTEKEAVTHGGMTAERSVTWDASSIPAGIYFVRLEAGREVASKKVVLMK